MCLNSESVSPEDLAALNALVNELPAGQLKEFLRNVHFAISEGGGICIGATPENDSDSDDPPEQLPPGIYPPPT